MKNEALRNVRAELNQMRAELGKLMEKNLTLSRHVTLGILDIQDFVHAALKELREVEQFVGPALPTETILLRPNCQ